MDKVNYVEVGEYLMNPKKIGKGNFSTIYIGYNKYSKRKVAIKKIEVENIFKLKTNVKREIELHKRLKHPNIVALYDIIFDNENHIIYLIMEYCDGGDFSKFQNKRPLKETHIHKYINNMIFIIKYNII